MVHNFHFNHLPQEESPWYPLEKRIGGIMSMGKRTFPPPAKMMLQPRGSWPATMQYATSHTCLRFSQQWVWRLPRICFRLSMVHTYTRHNKTAYIQHQKKYTNEHLAAHRPAAKQWLCKQWPLLSNARNNKTTVLCNLFLGNVSVNSVSCSVRAK
jgi:hypothetical protein